MSNLFKVNHTDITDIIVKSEELSEIVFIIVWSFWWL